jgi:methionyl-tRNA formyltransferase
MTQSDLRIVFAGTPEFAASHLHALIAGGFNVVSAYSQPDRPTGRGKQLLPTPVKAVALAHGIPVQQPLNLNDPAELATLAALRPDAMVVVAYGLLLPKAVLELPTYGCINVHASLLPRWRGAAPIERALMAGDPESGICIMQMDEGLDTGPVLKRISTPITDDDNSLLLTERLCRLGCEALCSILKSLPGAAAAAQKQNEDHATYARKINKAEALVDWSRSAHELHNLARALYPRSPAFCMHQGKRLRLIQTVVLPPQSAFPPGTIINCEHGAIDVACGHGTLRIMKVQLEGKNEMSIESLMNGHPGFFSPGMPLGAP